MKFYAVVRGRQPGIYDNWQECKAQVNEYSGAKYKGFATREAAEEFLNTAPEEQPIKKELPFAYIDGSFSKKNNCYGYGGFIFTGTDYYIIQGTGNHAKYLKERNIAGELIGALAIIHKCNALGINEINLYFDYAGIENYITGEWTAKTALAISYCNSMQIIAELYGVKINYIKVEGHTGITGNEIADYLAKEAVGAQLRKKDIAALDDFRNKTRKEAQEA
jgi:ribonuclease HI